MHQAHFAFCCDQASYEAKLKVELQKNDQLARAQEDLMALHADTLTKFKKLQVRRAG
jgi:hypothetical protein